MKRKRSSSAKEVLVITTTYADYIRVSVLRFTHSKSKEDVVGESTLSHGDEQLLPRSKTHVSLCAAGLQRHIPQLPSFRKYQTTIWWDYTIPSVAVLHPVAFGIPRLLIPQLVTVEWITNHRLDPCYSASLPTNQVLLGRGVNKARLAK